MCNWATKKNTNEILRRKVIRCNSDKPNKILAYLPRTEIRQKFSRVKITLMIRFLLTSEYRGWFRKFRDSKILFNAPPWKYFQVLKLLFSTPWVPTVKEQIQIQILTAGKIRKL